MFESVSEDGEGHRKEILREVDVRNLGSSQRQKFIEKVFKVVEEDNDQFLRKLRARIDRVGIRIPTVEVGFENLTVNAECLVGARALPTLSNSAMNFLEAVLGMVGLSWTKKTKLTILKNVSGIVKPSRITLLLGQPGSGKSTLLLALAGRLDKKLKVSGSVTYNGHPLEEFVPQKTSAYISQNDLHVGAMTVRETLDFSAKCQGVGQKYAILSELDRREKQAGILPDTEVDLFMKATSVEGVQSSLQTDYALKILGLDICADTVAGDEMFRGISGGQKKRLTTGEIIVGPKTTLFMDEISTGLDSSTTYQIVKCLQQFCSHMKATIVMSLLQPAPETFELFDDIILLSEGQVVYHGPRKYVLEFFQNCGFRCPERKGAADFLQEVTSMKDQEQYWTDRRIPYRYISVKEFADMYKRFREDRRLSRKLSVPDNKVSRRKQSPILSKSLIPKMEIFKICFAKEWLLLKRNSFIYIFKAVQIIFVAFIATTVFLRTRMHQRDEQDANLYLGALFSALMTNMFNGMAELPLTLARLPVFYKQRDLLLYPAWAFSLPSLLLSIPISFLESAVWIAITYYGIGLAPEAVRFFRHFLILFLAHQMSSSLFRFLAGLCRTTTVSNIGAALTLLLVCLFGGVIITKDNIPKWLRWGYWCSPLSYAQTSIVLNEMLDARWNKVSFKSSPNLALGLLERRNINPNADWYWIGAAALLGFSVLFNFLFTISLAYLNPLGKHQVIISEKMLTQMNRRSTKTEIISTDLDVETGGLKKRGMALPFKPLAMSFTNVNYFVDMPREMKEQGETEDKLQLLRNVTGAFRPGVLTALMGVTGAGKTTLMDVLAGRKTGGYIEGDIRISGFPKKQETFARISGYCEQTDIHSPQITVRESLLYSAFLRLPKEVDNNTKTAFVDEILELVELEGLRDALVGLPGVTGLSIEQRKRLTIAVELVANPSIIFMDEPTSGLDARSAAIVIRTVRNTVDTGRTVVCTIHQPSIDIFESFDELLLMKTGGQVIYAGPLGQNSEKVVEYFEAFPGVPNISYKQNPATWMLEVSSGTVEQFHGIDFAERYKNSTLYKRNISLAEELCNPPPGAKDLHFPTQFSQSFFEQFKFCLWKQNWSYWRSPDYNSIRILISFVVGALVGSIFWQLGGKQDNNTNIFNIIGGMYSAVLFIGVMNCQTVQPLVAVERIVFYRERAAGMYSAIPYALAQVTIEIPYTIFQTVVYTIIVYGMIGFKWTIPKFLWFFFINFISFLYFIYYGMMTVSITPNLQVATVLAGACVSLFGLFSGFFISRKKIPPWWVWYYWICPLAWTVYGLIVSQYGDITDLIEVDGKKQGEPLNKYLADYFGFDNDFLSTIAVVLVGFTFFFAFIFAFCIKVLNFQHR
ncbi:ABC transporter G family member 35-like isoform X2 [Cryptomeria japonica]|uniref:ABC transporter G family member 35-like isoform X2 n=1 Tax=Cryptomeria japonica TaxID=3369 RepID=UPI0027DA1B9F|nr:ABC transporter G family member 35-like isoform X2 [Cryptomeria japonica]